MSKSRLTSQFCQFIHAVIINIIVIIFKPIGTTPQAEKHLLLLLLARVALYGAYKRPIVVEHFRQPSVGLCVYVCVSVQCICVVAKRLIGYGCGLGR